MEMVDREDGGVDFVRSQPVGEPEGEGGAVPARYVINFDQAADLLGTTTVTLARWRKEPDFPKPLEAGGHGVAYAFDARDIRDWLERRRASEIAQAEAEAERVDQLRLELGVEGLIPEGEIGAGGGKVSSAALKLELENAAKIHQLGELRGMFIRRDELTVALDEVFSLFRATLTALSDRWAKTIGLGRDDLARVDRDIDEALRALVTTLRGVNDGDGDAGAGA